MDIKEFAGKIIELAPQIIRGFQQYENNYLTRGEITLPQFWALRCLKSDGKSTMHALAKHLNISPSATTGLIDRLITQGLVVRKAEPRDRRIVWIELTSKGEKILSSIREQKTKTLIKVFGKISPRDRAYYLNILEQVLKITTTLHK